MKRARESNDEASSSRTGTKKSKSIQACASCRKHKTRCEILDRSKSPVRCHRCQVLTLQCSYEDTMVPTAAQSTNTATPSDGMASANVQTSLLNATVAYPVHLPPTDRLWSFVSDEHTGVDWSAPMLAIQQLTKLPFAHMNVPAPPPLVLPPGELTLARVLPDEQIRYLLDIFDERYTPWLNFRPERSTNSPLLDSVCCAVAARHLDNGPANTQVKMLLQKLTEDMVAKMIFNPRQSESPETIQALLILSLWTPLGGPSENEGRDGRLLIASAVSMAMNLRLNHASLKALALKKRNDGRLSAEEAETLDELVEKSRLWIALTITESMLCLGTGRVPLSRRSPEDMQLVAFPKSFNGVVEYGDMRLGLAASAFDLAEEGATNRLQPGMDVDNWYDGIMIILEKLKRVKRLLVPLPYVLEQHQFYFHMLHVFESMSRLMVLYNALWDARVSVGHIPLGESWHTHFRPHGMEAVGEWGRDMVQATEALLTTVIGADLRLLATAPDNIFTMVALAAGYLVGVKFLMFRGGTELLGGSDLILAKIVTNLGRLACGPGHAAQRSAMLVRGMIAKWEGRHNKSGAGNKDKSQAQAQAPAQAPRTASPLSSYPTPTSDRHVDLAPPPTGASGAGGTPNSEYLELSAFTAPGVAASAPELDFSMFMDTISLDAEFWNNLAQQTQLLPGYE